MAICHPLRAHTMSNLQRVIKLVFVIWLMSAACALPLALQFGIRHESLTFGGLTNDVALCTLKNPIRYSFELSTFVFFVIPLCLLTVLYIQIGLHLRRSENSIVRQLTASNLHSPALTNALVGVNSSSHRTSSPADQAAAGEQSERLLSDPPGLMDARNGSPSHLTTGSSSPTRCQPFDKKASLRSQTSSSSFSNRFRSWKFFDQRSNSTRTMGASNNSRRAVIKMLGKYFYSF